MAKNVLGTDLETCSMEPLTGWFRNGCCDTDSNDHGMHTVCIQASQEFLQFSKAVGNDLSTPLPQYHFAGVKPGDRWCLCMSRWVEAHEAGYAPKVFLEGTHISVLEHIELDLLREFAIS